MGSDASRGTISSIHDAALVSDLWPSALQSVMDDAGAVGAGYSVFNKRTKRVEWLNQSGTLVGPEGDYFSYYQALDRYRPILETLPAARWLQISECLPETVLRRDEWYNDYLLKAGIDDALSARLFESPSHIVVFGVSHGIDQAPFTRAGIAALQTLLQPLANAARLQVELHSLRWKSSVALLALDQLGAAVIIADSDGRVIQTNRAAERVLQRGDGLKIRNGKLGALDASESAGLKTAIAAAAVEQKTPAAIGRMRVRRHDGRLPYVLTVAPLGTDLTVYGQP